MEAYRVVSFRDRLLEFGLKYVNYFEPFAAVGISYFVNRELKRYRDRGYFSAYSSNVKRLGKWHYLIEVDLDATSKQVRLILAEISRQLNGLGRR